MKNLSVLVVANNARWASLEGKLAQLRVWFDTAVHFEFHIKNTSYQSIPFVKYVEEDEHQTLKEPYGIEPYWYDQNVSRLAQGYDIVLFLLPVKQWRTPNSARGWRGDKNLGPVELQIACDEEEALYKFDPGSGKMVKIEDTFYTFARHELCHALYLISGQEDKTHEFLREDRVYKVLGDIKFPIPRENDIISIKERLIELIQKLLPLLKNRLSTLQEMEMTQQTKIEQFCLAIQEMEGYFEGSRAFRNKNPGNVKYVEGMKLAIGKDKAGFAVFNSYEDGFTFLKNLVYKACTGQSKIYKPDMTILQFFQKYAPSSDGNYPTKYAEFVAGKVALQITNPIKDLL